MSEYIKIEDIKANDILIWSELENRFVNIEPTLENLNISALDMKLQPLSDNASVIKKIANGDTIQQRGIVAGNNISITYDTTDITISANFDGDATSLGGFPHTEYVRKNEITDLIDVNEIIGQHDVYSKSHAHDVFMESNSSNIPDKDNVYDLGSNGRRYADIFAVTFHGTATKSIISQNLTQNGANQGDILTWDENKWRPRSLPSIPIEKIKSFDVSSAKHKDIMQYDQFTKRWKNVSIETITDNIDVPMHHFRTVGNDGIGLLHNIQGLEVQFKSLVAGEGVFIQESTTNNKNVVISLDESFLESLVFTTDEVSEGNQNLYFTNDRVLNTVRNEVTINDLDFVDTVGMEVGKVAFWDGSKISFMEIEIPEVITSVRESEDVDADDIGEDQVLIWNGEKFIPHTIPENTDILDGVDTTNATGKFLTWDGNEYKLKEIVIGMTLDDVDISRAENGHVLTWNGNTFVLREIGEGGAPVPSDMLSEVNTTNALDGYVLTWNGSGYVLSKIPRQYFDLNDINDVDSEAQEGQVLTYDGNSYVFKDIPEKVITFSDISDILHNANDGQYFVYSDGQYRFIDLPEYPTIPETFSIDAIEEYDGVEDGKVLKIENGKIVGTDIHIPDSITEFQDVNFTEITNDKILATKDGSIVLIDMPETEQEFSLEDITNVSGGTEEGQKLTYRNGSYVFENSVIALEDLDDVNVTGRQEGQVLTYYNGEYSFQDQNSTNELLSLTDVDSSGLDTGKYLKWNGSSFVFSDIDVPEIPEQISNFIELDDVNISNLEDGKILRVQSGKIVLDDISEKVNSNLYEMADVDIEFLETGHFLQWNGDAFVLSPVDFPDTVVSLDDITDVSTEGAVTGQVLTFNGSGYSFKTITSEDGISNFVELDDVNISTLTNGKILGVENGNIVEKDYPENRVLNAIDVDSSNVQDDYVLTYENGGLVFKAVPESTNISTISQLDDVDITGANDGQILTIQNGNIVATDAPEIPEQKEFSVLEASDVDSSASNGQVLTYQNGTLVFESIDIPEQTDKIEEFTKLVDVDIDNLVDGNYLTVQNGKVVQSGLEIKNNLQDLDDVSINNATAGQYLSWNGSEFVLSDIDIEQGNTSTTDLEDVDSETQPQDGEVLTYDAEKGKYSPKALPFDLEGSDGSGGQTYPNTARYEIVRLNHRPDDGLAEVIPYTDGIVHSGTVDADFNIVEFQFPGYRYPPLSAFTYGYVYEENFYNISPVLLIQERLRLDGMGEPGAPLAFEEKDENNPYTFTVSARTSETNASRSSGFPPEPTHTFIVFVMGG